MTYRFWAQPVKKEVDLLDLMVRAHKNKERSEESFKSLDEHTMVYTKNSEGHYPPFSPGMLYLEEMKPKMVKNQFLEAMENKMRARMKKKLVLVNPHG